MAARSPKPAPEKPSPRQPASSWLQLAVALLLPLNLELLLHLQTPPEAWGDNGDGTGLYGVSVLTSFLQHLQTTTGALGERREELYGFLSLLSLLLVLLTRRVSGLRPYRRALGLAAFGYGLYHGLLAVQHVLQGDASNLLFLNPYTQAGIWAGTVALAGLLPLALTSFASIQRQMGRGWKRLHRAGPWLTLLSALHTAWSGVHFGLSPLTWASVPLLTLSLALFLLRKRRAAPRISRSS